MIQLFKSNSKNNESSLSPTLDFHSENFYTRKLKESRPSEAEQFSKENQPVQRILGSTNQVEISYNGEVINTILNTRVSAENRGIQVNSEKINDFPVKLRDKLQIEILRRKVVIDFKKRNNRTVFGRT